MSKVTLYSFRSFDTSVHDKEILDLLDMVVPINQLPQISKEKKIVAYGCGDLGRMCREFCLEENIDISVFVDANYDKVIQNPYWNNENVKPLEFLRELDKKETAILICVVNYPLEDIFTYLRKLGFEDVVTFYDFAEITKTSYPLENGWLAGQSSFHKKRAAKVARFFNDVKSVKHYLSFIAWRFAREEWKFSDCKVETHNRFLIDEVKSYLSGKQVLVDIGAHIGSISIQFEDYLGSDLEKIYCFEPDQENRLHLLTNLQANVKQASKFEILDAILWSSVDDIRFLEGFNYASSITAHGSIKKSSTLDSFDLAPTILKIHTEGSELDIIQGSLKTIRKTRPLIMLTVYHNSQGLYQTLEFLEDNLSDYDLVFRAHSWAGTGAVVYCLPNKRI